jgi:uncharacterized coiled-coil DUF342 family protein
MAEAEGKRTLAQLYEQRRGIIEQLKKIRARRNELINEAEEIAAKLEAERRDYRELKERLHELNEDRRNLQESIREAKRRYREATSQLDGIRPALKGKGEDLEREIQKIEWRIQTEPLTKEQERGLLAKMREMAYMLSVWKKAYDLKDEASKLDRDLDEKAAALFDVKADRQETLKLIEEKRAKMAEYTQAGRQVYSEAEGLDQDIEELESRFQVIDARLRELRTRLEAELRQERSERRSARLAATKEAIERAKRAALEKVQRGESISIYDLRLLYDEDSVN